MTIVAAIILKLISSSSIIHPKKTVMTGLIGKGISQGGGSISQNPKES